MSFVLDASLALSWLFEDEKNAYSEAVRDSLNRNEALVPTLWPVEVANALVVAKRKKRISPETVERGPLILGRLPIRIDQTEPQMVELIRLAQEHQLSTYDALYLLLAMSRGVAMATLDGKLEAACRTARVHRFEP